MWSKLEPFYHIVKAGSLINAAKILKTDQPALTHKLKSLETKFGFKLINRSTPKKALTLTRKGEEVFKVAEATFLLIQQMNMKLYDKGGFEGKVRLSTTHAIANYLIGDSLIDFALQYPSLEVELICSDTNLDLHHNEVDFALIPYVEENPNLVQEHLFTLETGLYASPDYLEKFGEPKTVEDLDHHRLITFARPDQNPFTQVEWLLKLGREGKEKRKSFYSANSISNFLGAAEKGAGIVTFYEILQRNRNSNLVRILKDVKGPEYKACLAYPKELVGVERIEALKNFIIQRTQGL